MAERRCRCRCHSASIYRSLVRCPRCGHHSVDPGIGCERRRCGYEVPEEEWQAVQAKQQERS